MAQERTDCSIDRRKTACHRIRRMSVVTGTLLVSSGGIRDETSSAGKSATYYARMGVVGHAARAS